MVLLFELSLRIQGWPCEKVGYHTTTSFTLSEPRDPNEKEEKEGLDREHFPRARFLREPWRGMRPTFPLFIVSRCLCFTRPSRGAVHDKAGKGGITERTNNVMYYT